MKISQINLKFHLSNWQLLPSKYIQSTGTFKSYSFLFITIDIRMKKSMSKIFDEIIKEKCKAISSKR